MEKMMKKKLKWKKIPSPIPNLILPLPEKIRSNDFIFVIYNIVTKEYSLGGQWPRWTTSFDKAKKWANIGFVKNHLNGVREHALNYRHSNIPNAYSMTNWILLAIKKETSLTPMHGYNIAEIYEN